MFESLVLAVAAAAEPQPPSATEVMVEFARAFCLAEVDRVAVARKIVPQDWKVTKKEERRDITYGVDAPTPTHDRIEQTWQGRVPGGSAWLNILSWDEKEPSRRDTSWATFGVSPGALVDLTELQRRVPMRLRPEGPPRHGTRDRPLVTDREGRPYPTPPATYEWDQSYVGSPTLPNSDVRIEAVHLYGAGPLRKFWMKCETAPDPAGRLRSGAGAGRGAATGR